jgi:glycosyltransferase involved in cell wall biosynthesis
MSGVDPESPRVTVVIACIVGGPFIDSCLESLEAQSRGQGVEVIVVVCGEASLAERVGQAFPWVQVLHVPERESVPKLRRRGVLQARGGIVAIIEEHCLAAPDWIARLAEAHESGDYGAVGGPVVDNGYDRVRDWVVYFLEYNISLPPAPGGEVTFLNGANVAYRRSVLLEHEQLLSDGYWEATLHPVLLGKGVKLLSVPAMVVRHRGPFDFGYYLRQRYWFSRAFAGARALRMPAVRRLGYLVAAPIIPFLLLGRMSARVWRKRCRRSRYALALPLLLPALAVYVAGEWAGYAAGPGNALSKVE